MRKNIFEELPARKFAPAGPGAGPKEGSKGPKSGDGPKGGKGPSSGKAPGGSNIDEERAKKIRQAIYDIRYRARREGIDIKVAYSQYMQNSSMSEQDRAEVRAKLFDKPEDETRNEERNPYELFLDFLVNEGYAYSYKDAANIMSDLDEEALGAVIDFIREELNAPEIEEYVEEEADVYEEIFSDVYESSIDLATNALKKVFVESKELDEEYLEELKQDYVKKEMGRVSRGAGVKKYKVRVCDPQSGVCYSRFATRQKITELRARGLNVEMSEHGDAYEGDEEERQQKSRALGNVAKAKKDFDGDGEVESPGKEYRGVIHNKIQKKKGKPADGQDTSSVKEDYFVETMRPTKNQNKKKLNPTNVKNKIVVFPDDKLTPRMVNSGYEAEGEVIVEKAKSEAQQKFMGMVYAVKKGAKPMSPEVAKAAKSITSKEARKFASTKHKGLPSHVAKEETTFTEPGEIPSFGIKPEDTFGVKEKSCDSKKKKDEVAEVDPRSMKTSSSLLKTKLRYYGIRV